MRRVPIVGLGIVLLLVASAAAATSTAGQTYWGRGVRALLSANAARNGNQSAEIDYVSCPSPGNCGAVGIYYDHAWNRRGLLLSETAGHWAAGVEARLPAGSGFSRRDQPPF